MYTKMNGMRLLVRCCSVEGKLSGNRHDPYTVATLSDGRVVGHMPRGKTSPVCSIFIRRGGSITCTVGDRRRYSADLEQGALEIPCKIKFLTSSSVEKEKAEKLETAALSNNETNGLSKFWWGNFWQINAISPNSSKFSTTKILCCTVPKWVAFSSYTC